MYPFICKLKMVYTIAMVMLLAAAFFNIFYGLTAFPIFSWDEARHGVSAYEMLKKGNLIVNTYRYKIDYWNLKPPLSFWITIAGYKIAGFNVFGLRLFSALFAVLTIILVAIFVHKQHGPLASLISMAFLITNMQFLANHSARTGDADVLFVFFFTASILSLLLSVQNINWIYLSGTAFSLAFLTKSWHAANIIIIIFLFLIITKKYRNFSIKNWALLFSCMVLPILAWGIVRYQYDGIVFFRKMIAYDLLKRSATSIEGHIGPKYYYLEILWRYSKYWLLLFIIFMNSLANEKIIFKARNKTYYIGIGLWLVIPLLLYSLAETKIRWYILPVYPVLSIMIGAAAGKSMQNGKFVKKAAVISLILLVSLNYEAHIVNYLHHPIPKLQLSLIQKIQGADGLKGYSLFKYNRAGKVSWYQNTVLAAELFGDLRVKDGDFNEFLQAKRALLLVKKERNTSQLIKRCQLKIAASNEWGYIVYKKSINPNRKIRAG